MSRKKSWDLIVTFRAVNPLEATYDAVFKATKGLRYHGGHRLKDNRLTTFYTVSERSALKVARALRKVRSVQVELYRPDAVRWTPEFAEKLT